MRGHKICHFPIHTESLHQVSVLIDGHYCLLIIVVDVTVAQVRLTLAEEDKKRVEEGRAVPHDVSASVFLSMGMDIQGQQ